SNFAKALAANLAKQHNASSEVHWGNSGFCVDLAMLHPTKAEDVTIGVQCDMTRYGGSDDPVEWDVVQHDIHEHQGWKLFRVWSPHFFRDPDGTIAKISSEMAREAASSSNSDVT